MSAWKSPEAITEYYAREIDSRAGYMRELRKEMLEGAEGQGEKLEEETLVMIMVGGGSSQKKRYNKEEFGSNLSVVKYKPQERQSMMNDSIWSGITSIKHDLATQSKL